MQIEIEQVLYATLRERVTKLAKKAEKCGTQPPTLTVISERVKEWTDQLGWARKTPMYTVELDATTAVIAGWKFVASVEHHQNEHGDWTNIVSRAPDFYDVDLGINFNTVPSRCEHCGQNRDRNHTYYWQNEADARLIQVGSTCLKDFAGHNISIPYLDALDEFRESLGSLSNSRTLALTQLLHTTIKVIAHKGRYIKRDDDYGRDSTASTVNQVLLYPNKDWAQEILNHPTDPAAEVAAIREWVEQSLPETEYISNLKVAFTNELTTSKFNLIVSAVPAYRAHLLRLAAQAEQPQREPEVKVPVMVGDAVEIVGTVIKWEVKDYGNYSREVMVVKDDRGFAVWGTVPAKLASHSDMAVGAKVKFTAEVTASNGDEHFGFFARPKKAELIAAA